MRAYPYDRWPRISRADAAAQRAQARGGPLAALAGGAASAGSWLGAEVRVDLAGPPRAHVAELGDPIVAVLLDEPLGARAALVLDAAIASAIVDRTVGGDGDGLEAVLAPLRDVERGVLAYAIARWIAGRSSFVIAAVLTSAPALAAHLGDVELVRWPLAVRIGAARGGASLLVPRALEPSTRRVVLPSWAGSLPIEQIVEAGIAVLSSREIASLERGDVVIPDRSSLTIDRGALAGAVSITTRRARRAFTAELVRGELRITGVELRSPSARGAREVTMKDPEAVLDAMGDTPVTLTLELARFTLPLEEIAALAPGEIVRAGVAIGERVTLRAGDRVVASGELVDVDGEVGVRILELAK